MVPVPLHPEPCDDSDRCQGQLGDLFGRPVGTCLSVELKELSVLAGQLAFSEEKKGGDLNGFLKMYDFRWESYCSAAS